MQSQNISKSAHFHIKEKQISRQLGIFMFLTSLLSCPDVVKCICLFSEKCPTHLSDCHLIPVSPSKHRDRLSHLGKVLTIQMWIPKFSLQDPYNPSTSRQKHAGSWGSAASQPKLVCEPSASERPCLKKIQGGQFLRNNKVEFRPPHAHAHTHALAPVHMCAHVCARVCALIQSTTTKTFNPLSPMSPFSKSTSNEDLLCPSPALSHHSDCPTVLLLSAANFLMVYLLLGVQYVLSP